ncbi:hypothetical protein BKA70DRAFT_1436280 [Coprinopsis sp. MPI-PUGE-AT-0042]|nr:hypothetical protein BKA70DRAFT_1436280 [Coprinopsis sp. MPI-PUGE-AT-0042]
MDGTFALLLQITQMIEEMFPLGNADLAVDEAQSTGIYGPEGRGRIALFGLEDKVLARLVTFGKALAATSDGAAGWLHPSYWIYYPISRLHSFIPSPDEDTPTPPLPANTYNAPDS